MSLKKVCNFHRLAIKKKMAGKFSLDKLKRNVRNIAKILLQKIETVRYFDLLK